MSSKSKAMEEALTFIQGILLRVRNGENLASLYGFLKHTGVIKSQSVHFIPAAKRLLSMYTLEYRGDKIMTTPIGCGCEFWAVYVIKENMDLVYHFFKTVHRRAGEKVTSFAYDDDKHEFVLKYESSLDGSNGTIHIKVNNVATAIMEKDLRNVNCRTVSDFKKEHCSLPKSLSKLY